MDMTIEQALSQLAQSSNRPVAARFREAYFHIENALSAGATRQQVRDELEKLGFSMTLNTFNVMLTRCRKGTPKQNRLENLGSPSRLHAIERFAPSGLSAKSRVSTPSPNAPETLVQVELPDDWLDANLSFEQLGLLTDSQKKMRDKARVRKYMPNAFDIAKTQKASVEGKEQS